MSSTIRNTSASKKIVAQSTRVKLSPRRGGVELKSSQSTTKFQSPIKDLSISPKVKLSPRLSPRTGGKAESKKYQQLRQRLIEEDKKSDRELRSMVDAAKLADLIADINKYGTQFCTDLNSIKVLKGEPGYGRTAWRLGKFIKFSDLDTVKSRTFT